jgi:hypothetical protein
MNENELRYNWRIELIPEDPDTVGDTEDFVGTRTEAERRADQMADAASYDYEVKECVLHRRGLAPDEPRGESRQ